MISFMATITQEHFDKHYKELIEFLSEQFSKLATKEELDQKINELETRMDERFAEVYRKFARIDEKFEEMHIKLDFIQAEVAGVKKALDALSKRTREDDDALNREIIKLKSRVAHLEKRLEKFLAQAKQAVKN
jgi:flagellar capping protein FliD